MHLTPLRAYVHVQVVENTYQGYGEGGAYAHSLAQEEGSQPHLRQIHDTIIGPSPRGTRDQASFELSDLQGVSQAGISVSSDRSRIHEGSL